jgi:hypothetical protein
MTSSLARPPLRTVKNNFTFYQHDGLGRDGYISYNNGGFWKDNQVKLYKAKDLSIYSRPICVSPPNPRAPPFKYVCDGSGRDSYIMCDEGGLVRHYTPYNSLDLKHYLRNESGFSSPVRDPFRKTGYMSKADRKLNCLLYRIQRNVVNRLYNNEKKKFLPVLSKHKLFVENVENNKGTRYGILSFGKGESYIPFLRSYSIKNIDSKKINYDTYSVLKSKSVEKQNKNDKMFMESMRKKFFVKHKSHLD